MSQHTATPRQPIATEADSMKRSTRALTTQPRTTSHRTGIIPPEIGQIANPRALHVQNSALSGAARPKQTARKSKYSCKRAHRAGAEGAFQLYKS